MGIVNAYLEMHLRSSSGMGVMLFIIKHHYKALADVPILRPFAILRGGEVSRGSAGVRMMIRKTKVWGSVG